MEMYDTIPEAIEICRNTYRGRVYTIQDDVTLEIITGTAYDIYARLAADYARGIDKAWWPVNDYCVEECALMEVIFFAEWLTHSRPRYDFEFDAINLVNQIAREQEGMK